MLKFFFDEYGFATNLYYWLAPAVLLVLIGYGTLRLFGRRYNAGLLAIVLCTAMVVAGVAHAVYRPSGRCVVREQGSHAAVCDLSMLRGGDGSVPHLLSVDVSAQNLLVTHPLVEYPELREKYKSCLSLLKERNVAYEEGRLGVREELYLCRELEKD